MKTAKTQDNPDGNFFLDDEEDDNKKEDTNLCEVRMNNEGEIIEDETETIDERKIRYD